ncbi:NAD+ kinase [Motilibacter rhizosphaerae]|uniref:NAD kinase n=1 Tax=Motilibacter rhizosphaerae TaxID=598652 RepID=A0A4V2F2V7_9ACTN|nr:NAD kinase [Motilibacter rhizosphaerae]RZS80234.1 NAD+ kinase [Motilibacter rhizosphaerae]
MTGLRVVLLVVHTGRPEALPLAERVVARLTGEGVSVLALAEEAGSGQLQGTTPVSAEQVCYQCPELIVVLGGDGTILRAAELARDTDVPVLGVNLGRVGFLAEAEPADIDSVADRILEQSYDVEERMTLGVEITLPDGSTRQEWAVNDISVEKADRALMLDLAVEVDGRPLSVWGCDGVVCATPTGSTAYNFSAGGPIVWPEVEALLLTPLSAHALFNRPLVTAPTSTLAIELLKGHATSHERCGILWADGRRSHDLPPGARIEVRRGDRPVRLARLRAAPFTDRLVAKFRLPVQGWRGPSSGGS